MTKSELIAEVAEKTQLNKALVQKILECIISSIIDSLKVDPRLPLYGLGTFEVIKRSKRKGRNPRTGEPLTVKAHKAIKFKPAKAFKDAVNSPK
jgi:DNA-binding protein HU-beta